MAITVRHSLTMTSPDDPLYENKPSNWNESHVLNGAYVEAISAAGGSGSGTVIFGNSPTVTFGYNAGTVTASAAGGAGVTPALSGSNGSFTYSTATFGALNGLTFYTSNGSMVGSYTVPTTQNAAFSGSNGSFTAATVTFGSSNGMHFYTTNGSMIGSYTQSNQALSGSNGSFTFQTATFGSLNGMHFYTSNGSLVGSYTVPSTQNPAFSGSNGSFTAQTVTFGSSNGMHFYTTNGSIVGSYTVPTQSNQTLGLYAVSNTTGASSSSTFDARTISFQGAGIASVGFSNGSVVISVPSGGGAGDGGVFAGVSTGGNTAGSTGTVSTGNFVLVGGSGITLSQSTGAAGSAATVTINGPAPITIYEDVWGNTAGSFTSSSFAQNSVYVAPYIAHFHVSAIAVKMFASLNFATSATNSGQRTWSVQWGIYSRHSTNSDIITQFYSTDWSLSGSYSSNVSMAYQAITGISDSTSYRTESSSSAGVNVSSLIVGAREIIMPFSSVLTPGEYWQGFYQTASNAGTVGNLMVVSNYGYTTANARRLGVSAGVNVDGAHRNMMAGVYSAAGALPGSFSSGQINLNAFLPMGMFVNQTL